jgi:cobalt/nickel transport system permease protein
LSDMYLDQYQNRDSALHRSDARAKFIFSLVFILAVVMTDRSQWFSFLAFLGIIGITLSLSKLSLKSILKRSLVVLPFAFMVGVFLPFFKHGETLTGFHLFSWDITISREGSEMLAALLIKSWVSLLCLIWLTTTTPVNTLLQALKKLHFPAMLVMILFFMYRYIFVIVDEIRRMMQARDCRSNRGGIFWNIRTAGNMIGTLFIRSYERSERVYAAMSARGYDGQTRTLDELIFKKSDIVIFTLLLSATVAIAVISLLIRSI